MPHPSHEVKFSGANGDREILVFPVQLTTDRIGNLIRLIHTLLYVMTTHTYYHGGKNDQNSKSKDQACKNPEKHILFVSHFRPMGPNVLRC